MTKKVKIGNVVIGGGEKIAVQSMSTHKIKDIEAAVYDSERLKKAGCDILRFSVLDDMDARAIKELKKRVDIPIVADIHYDYRLAISAIESGADKIRINPGNIGAEENVIKVAAALKEYGTPVRVGSNTGSIEKEYLNKYGKSEIALAESALKNVRILEKYGVDKIHYGVFTYVVEYLIYHTVRLVAYPAVDILKRRVGKGCLVRRRVIIVGVGL